MLLDPGSVPVVFNGNLAHEVEDYEGEERFSVILFTHEKYELASAETRSVLQETGCSWPTLASLQILSKWDPSGSPIEKPCSGKKSGDMRGAASLAGHRIKRLWSGKPSKRIAGQQSTVKYGASGSKHKQEMGDERPKKIARQETPFTRKSWVCPFTGCGHEMGPRKVGQVVT